MSGACLSEAAASEDGDRIRHRGTLAHRGACRKMLNAAGYAVVLKSSPSANDSLRIFGLDTRLSHTGTNEIWHLLDHTRTSFSALSKFEELGRQGKYIVGVSAFKNSFAGIS